MGVRKNWFVGTIDRQSPKMIRSNNSDWYFNFNFYSQQAVCVCLVGGDVKNFCFPRVPCPQSRSNTVPYLSKIYGKPCTWWQEFSLELSFEAQSSLQIFEVLNLVFACICNENDQKVIKSWNNSDTSVLYSSKSTRCDKMIYFHACSVPPVMNYHWQFSFSPKRFLSLNKQHF